MISVIIFSITIGILKAFGFYRISGFINRQELLQKVSTHKVGTLDLLDGISLALLVEQGPQLIRYMISPGNNAAVPTGPEPAISVAHIQLFIIREIKPLVLINFQNEYFIPH